MTTMATPSSNLEKELPVVDEQRLRDTYAELKRMEVHLDPNPHLALVGLCPEADPWGFRSNAVVVLDRLDRGMTLWAWQDGADQLMPGQLRDYLPIDRAPVQIGDRAGVQRLAHHNADGRSVTMAQWATVDGARGYTLTVSVSTLAYPHLVETVAHIGASFQIAGVTQ